MVIVNENLHEVEQVSEGENISLRFNLITGNAAGLTFLIHILQNYIIRLLIKA